MTWHKVQRSYSTKKDLRFQQRGLDIIVTSASLPWKHQIIPKRTAHYSWALKRRRNFIFPGMWDATITWYQKCNKTRLSRKTTMIDYFRFGTCIFYTLKDHTSFPAIVEGMGTHINKDNEYTHWIAMYTQIPSEPNADPIILIKYTSDRKGRKTLVFGENPELTSWLLPKEFTSWPKQDTRNGCLQHLNLSSISK